MGLHTTPPSERFERIFLSYYQFFLYPETPADLLRQVVLQLEIKNVTQLFLNALLHPPYEIIFSK